MITKYTILFVASPWLGGSGTVAYRMADYLSKNGFKVHFLSYEIPFKQIGKGKIIYHKVEGYFYPLFPFPLYELALAEKITSVVKNNNINVIHAHYGILFGHAALLAKTILEKQNIDIKVVLTFHGSDVIGFDLECPGKKVTKELNEWIGYSADAITVASNNLKLHAQKLYGINREIKVIPNFINTNKYSPTKKSIQTIKFLHISNFRKVKQTLMVIKIYKRLKKIHPKISLVLIGEGPDLKKVKNYIKKYNIKNVKVTGKIQNENTIIEYIRQSHVLLLPSLYENFPLVALEAQACGVPVIASDCGGIPEIVKHNNTGYLSESKNLQNFVINTNKLISNQKIWNKFSINAINNARSYDIEKVMDNYLQLYEQLFSKNSSSTNSTEHKLSKLLYKIIQI